MDELLDLKNYWLLGRFFYQPEVMFSREIWERSGGGLDESLYYSMDYELWLRMADAGAKVEVIGAPVAHYRVHEKQKTFTPDFQGELENVAESFARKRALARVEDERPIKHPLKFFSITDIGFNFGAGIGHRRYLAALRSLGHSIQSLQLRIPEEVPMVDVQKILSEIDDYHPDLVIMGNLHGAKLGGWFIHLVLQKSLVAFFMHDLWLASGRCAYPGDCTKNLTGCDETCPTAGEYPALAPSKIANEWHLKRDLLQSERFYVLGNSQHTIGSVLPMGGDSDLASRSGVVYYPIDPIFFSAGDRISSRQELDLPQDKFIILIIAANLSDVRKGIHLLPEAIDRLPNPEEILVISAGHTDNSTPLFDKISYKCFGKITDLKILATLFSAADVFVGPSLQEAFGQVFIEAAALGTPSIGFKTGGVPEAIADGITGIFSEEISSAGISKTIQSLREDPSARALMGKWSRIYARCYHSAEKCAHDMHQFLSRVLASQGFRAHPKMILVENMGVEEPKLAKTGTIIGLSSGLFPEEGPYPEMGLPRCRWASDKDVHFWLDIKEEGELCILGSFASLIGSNRFAVFLDGQPISELKIERYLSDGCFHSETIQITCQPGRHTLTFRPSVSVFDGERNISVLFLGLFVILDGRCIASWLSCD